MSVIHATDFGKETAVFLSGMSAAAAILLLVGLILAVVEFFRPMKGLGYYTGGAVLAVGMMIRMFSGGSVGTLFIMLLIVSAVLLGSHLTMIALHKREWLFVASGYDFDEPGDGDEYSYLVGLKGITTTRVDMSGHMSINDVNFYVTSRLPIDVGVEVIVRKVSGVEIIVEPTEGNQTA